MIAEKDKETGYLLLKDVSDGIRITSVRAAEEVAADLGRYNVEVARYETRIEMLEKQIDKLERQLTEERRHTEEILFNVGRLYDCLNTVRRAHYLQGYADGAWNYRGLNIDKKYEQLLQDTSDFSPLLEDTLHSLTSLIEKK